MPADNRKLALLSLMAAGVLSMFFRSYVATLTPAFIEEFGMTPQQIGALSTAFFIAYAAGHFPSAVAFDRFGVGRIAGPLLLLGAGATYLASVATSPSALIVSQALLGLGCSASFVGLFHYAARHQSERFVNLATLSSALGLAGGILASLPLSMFVGTFGWRAAMLAVTCSMLVLAMLVCLAVREHPPARDARPLHLSGVIDGVRRILVIRPLWPVFGIWLIVPAVPTLRTAWGGQYLEDVFGANLDEIGAILLVSNLVSFGIMLGASFIPAKAGSLEMVYAAICATIATLVCFALFGATSRPAAALLFGLISVSGVAHMYLLGRVRSLLPPDPLGLGLGLFGSVLFIGFGLATTLTGWLLALASAQGLSAPGRFTLVFAVAAVAIALVTLCCPLASSRPEIQPNAS